MGNRGLDWQASLHFACKHYRKAGIARVERVYEPYVQVGNPDKRGFFRARRIAESPPDFMGNVAMMGSVLFDAKEVKGGRWSFNYLKKHQAMDLTAEMNMGGTAFLAIRFNAYGGPSVVVHWADIRKDWWAWKKGVGSLKSLTVEDGRVIPWEEHDGRLLPMWIEAL